MTSKVYAAEIPHRPTEVFDMRALNEVENRGAIITEITASYAEEEWAQSLQCPSKLLSISGERVTTYTFKSIQKTLDRCALPVRLKFEYLGDSFVLPPLKGTQAAQSGTDSESETDPSYHEFTTHSAKSKVLYQKRSSYTSRYNSKKPQKYQPKYEHGRSESQNLHQKHAHAQSDSQESMVSVSFGASGKQPCKECMKPLKESKQHRCRRCAAVTCSKCSKNKRKEVGYDKLVRVCDGCVKRDEFEVRVASKPLGIEIGSLYDKHDDLGGILIRDVRPNGAMADLQIEENVRFEKTVIIAVGQVEDAIQNIELFTYNDAIEMLRSQACPFRICCKKWNRNTKTSAKAELEKEHKEMSEQVQAADLENPKNGQSKTKKKLKSEDDEKTHQRNGTSSSIDEDPTASPHHSPIGASAINNTSSKPNDLFETNTNSERYTGSENIDEHPAMDLVMQAEEAEKVDDLETAHGNYESAIKQLNSTILALDNAKIKRKWMQKVNDYEMQRMRIQRKLRHRKRAQNGSSHLHVRNGTGTGSRGNRRSATMMPTARKQSNTKKNNNSNNASDKKDDGGGDGGDDNKENKGKKGKPSQDEEFRQRLEADIITETPNVTFRQVQGLANVKLAIYETVVLPQKRPELFTGLRAPSMGLLLFGPPGNGKTMIAKCIATEIASTFFSISASSITSKYVGDAERIMRTLFGLAREKAPSIIFIDEIDSLLTSRGGSNEAESSRRIKTEFLVQFDGVHSAKDLSASVLLVGATNLPDQLDEAVLRRFSKRIMVPHPDYDTRYGLLRNLMRDEPHELSDDDFSKLAKATDRYSCSDLAHVCKDAALGPLRDLGASLADDDFDSEQLPKISLQHFEDSLKNVRSSLSKESLIFYDKWNAKFGAKLSLSVDELPEFLRSSPIEPIDD